MNWSRPPKCVALDHRGRRCGRNSVCAHPVTFAWDPVKGEGLEGPMAAFCRMHDCWLKGPDRIEVVGGWFGDIWNAEAKVWTVLMSVFSTRDGHEYSKHWWDLRRPSKFGKLRDDQTFDEALGKMGGEVGMREHLEDCDGNGFVSCWKCGGEGGFHACGDDCCPHLYPELDLTDCEECEGTGAIECPECRDLESGQ